MIKVYFILIVFGVFSNLYAESKEEASGRSERLKVEAETTEANTGINSESDITPPESTAMRDSNFRLGIEAMFTGHDLDLNGVSGEIEERTSYLSLTHIWPEQGLQTILRLGVSSAEFNYSNDLGILKVGEDVVYGLGFKWDARQHLPLMVNLDLSAGTLKGTEFVDNLNNTVNLFNEAEVDVRRASLSLAYPIELSNNVLLKTGLRYDYGSYKFTPGWLQNGSDKMKIDHPIGGFVVAEIPLKQNNWLDLWRLELSYKDQVSAKVELLLNCF